MLTTRVFAAPVDKSTTVEAVATAFILTELTVFFPSQSSVVHLPRPTTALHTGPDRVSYQGSANSATAVGNHLLTTPTVNALQQKTSSSSTAPSNPKDATDRQSYSNGVSDQTTDNSLGNEPSDVDHNETVDPTGGQEAANSHPANNAENANDAHHPSDTPKVPKDHDSKPGPEQPGGGPSDTADGDKNSPTLKGSAHGGTFDNDDSSTDSATVEAPDPFPRLKEAKHWRIRLPLIVGLLPFIIALILTPVVRWVRLGGHRQHPRAFFAVLRHAPKELKLATEWREQEREAADTKDFANWGLGEDEEQEVGTRSRMGMNRRERRDEIFAERRRDWNDRVENQRIRTEIRQEELEERACARGDTAALARQDERKREATERKQEAAEASRRAAHRLDKAKRTEAKAKRREAKRQRRLAQELEEQENMDEGARDAKVQVQGLSLPEYQSAIKATLNAQVRRRAVVPSPVDPPVLATTMWLP